MCLSTKLSTQIFKLNRPALYRVVYSSHSIRLFTSSESKTFGNDNIVSRGLARRNFSTFLSSKQSVFKPNSTSLSLLHPSNSLSAQPLQNSGLAFKIDKYLELMRVKNACECAVVTIPGIWGLAMLTPAGSLISPILFAKFVGGGAAVLTSQCLMNDMIDVKIDRQVERTKMRPLANRDVSMLEACGLLTVTMSFGLAILTTLPPNCIAVGTAGVISMAAYPLFKRFFVLPGLIIGILNGLSIYMANIALNCPIDWNVVVPLHLAYIFWTLFYETVYSFQDIKDDTRIGIKSTAQAVGAENCKKFLLSVSTATSLCLAVAGIYNEQTIPYYLTVAIATGVWYKQANEFVPNQPYDVLKFFNMNGIVGTLVFFGALFGTYLKNKPTPVDRSTCKPN